MEDREFAKELERSTLRFAIKIVKLSTKLPNKPEGRVVKTQLSRAGTSIGANYREANRARSKADFKNKIAICESEASEAQYWLEMIKELGWLPWDEFRSDYEECGELLAIFTSIGKPG